MFSLPRSEAFNLHRAKAKYRHQKWDPPLFANLKLGSPQFKPAKLKLASPNPEPSLIPPKLSPPPSFVVSSEQISLQGGLSRNPLRSGSGAKVTSLRFESGDIWLVVAETVVVVSVCCKTLEGVVGF